VKLNLKAAAFGRWLSKKTKVVLAEERGGSNSIHQWFYRKILLNFLIELDIARNEGSYKKLMKQYRKYHLLILDEWMLVSLKENEARDVLEIIHARHHNASTIFCSQFAPAGWLSKIGEETIADAILDRIVHDSYLIEIHSTSDENSMREKYGIKRSI